MKLKRTKLWMVFVIKLIFYVLVIGIPSLLVLYIKLILKNSERMLYSEPIKKWWVNAD